MKLNKGLFRDVDPIDQPANTYRDAQNMLLTKRKNALSTEEGNTLRTSIPANYTIIGNSIVYDGRHVVFLAGKTGTAAEGESEIGTYEGTTYTTVLNMTELNFDPDSILEAVTLINNRGKVVAYWTDNINPPRFLNIDDAINDPTFVVDDITDLRVFSVIDSAPLIQLNSVQEGGSLVTGSYHFAIKYISEDDSETSYMQVTPPVYISDESTVSSPDSYDGAPAGSTTNKSILLDIENLDETFSEFRIAVIRKEKDTIAEVRELDDISITGESSFVQYNGGSQGLETSFDQITINSASYDRARTIAESDNTLYFGNVSQSAVLDYQKYANNIKVSAVQKKVTDGGTGIFTQDHYGNPKISFYDKAFKRGEVYALYIAFVLNNGTESEAFHIPGRAAEGTELTAFTDIDPNGKEYQFLSKPGTNNMAYWENETEQYPIAQQDEEGHWDIYDVNANGDPVDTGNSLHGQKVRHHHFPDVIHDQTFAPFYGTETGDANVNDRVYTLGVELSDVKIPATILEQIKGVKIYYAKRGTEDRRILDQGYAFSLSAQDVAESISGTDQPVWMFEPADGGSQISKATIINNFHSSRTRQNIGSASYVKFLQKFDGSNQEFATGDSSREILHRQMESFTARQVNEALYKIKDGTAITYVEKGGVQEATNRGFSFDILNFEGEQGIAVEFDKDVDFGNYTNDPNAADNSIGLIAEICAIRNDLFFPFDQQELVWTGKLMTDLSIFDAREQSTVAAPAEGEIEVTAGSNDIPDTQATCETEITSGTDADGGTINIAYDGNNVNISVDPSMTIDNLGDLLALQINSSVLTLTASYASGTNILTFTADDGEEAENGKTVTIDPLDSGATFSDLTPDMSGGQSLDDLVITLDTETITVNTPNNDTAANVASAINSAINLQSTNYSSTVSGTTVSITSNLNGQQYNGIIDVDAGNTGVTTTDTNLTGGSDGTAKNHYLIPEVYGGDTYIVRHGSRRTGWDTDGSPLGRLLDAPLRYLVEYVTESYDNIKLRHEGQGDGEIYYPQSSAEAVLTVEDVFGGDINIQNYIGYNPDYSAQAIIKSAVPANTLRENILRFPTRVIRSLQGNTNVGEDEGLRTFLENDFVDLSRKRGELVKLSVVNNLIIPHMERGMFRTKGREEVVVGDIRAFVGAGDIFAVDPDEIISTNDGFAGLQDPESAIVTPHGYFFVDRKAGKVFLISDGPQVISEAGMHNFFKDELKTINSDKQLIACYDNKWDRIILTYKGKWTISYYPTLQAWGSFHSYNPEYYLYDVETFYSIDNSGIYEHNIDTKSAEFYGTNDPSYIDFVDNRSPLQSKFAVNIEYISEVEGQQLQETSDQDTWGQGFGNVGAFSINGDRVEYSNPGFYDYRAFVNDSLGDVSDFDMKAKFRPEGDADNNQDVFGLAARIQDSGERGYVASYDLSFGSNPDRIKIIRFQDANNRTNIASEFELPFNLGTNEEVWIRFQGIGDTFKAKAWKDGTPEPASWNVTAVDSFTASGKLGYFNYYGFTSWSATLFEYSLEDAALLPFKPIYKETFDKFRINNNYQDSGDRNIVYFTSANGNARNVQGTWKINKFRNWKDPISGDIDVNKPWHEQERLIGKYARVKLTYNNSDNNFLYLYDAKVGQRVSQR